MCTTIITNVTNIDKKVVERAAKKRQKNGATSPTLFTNHPYTPKRVLTMPGEISVCSLWMHIRSLWMHIRSLWTAVRNLGTESPARCADVCQNSGLSREMRSIEPSLLVTAWVGFTGLMLPSGSNSMRSMHTSR